MPALPGPVTAMLAEPLGHKGAVYPPTLTGGPVTAMLAEPLGHQGAVYAPTLPGGPLSAMLAVSRGRKVLLRRYPPLNRRLSLSHSYLRLIVLTASVTFSL